MTLQKRKYLPFSGLIGQKASGENGKNTTLMLTCLFGAFAFLQFTVLGLANHAGEGLFSIQKRDLVYYALQIFVIFGYLLYALVSGFVKRKQVRTAVVFSVIGAFPVLSILLCLLGPDSILYVIVSMCAALCLGILGGHAHLRMSMASRMGSDAARSMGLGSSAAIVLQYFIQIRWSFPWLLLAFMLMSYALFLIMLRQTDHEETQEEGGKTEKTMPGRIVLLVVITAIFILFACFYNEFIHHLMIRSGYASANVYSWPRLMMVQVYLLFAAIGDRKRGKYVPIVSLCIMLIALLNAVLIGNSGAYWLNMCFFYIIVAANTCYYLLGFWNLAPGTKHPALWAPFGRMLDSAMVLIAGILNISSFPMPVVLGAEIVGIAAVIVMMAAGGNFNLNDPPAAPMGSAVLSAEETLERIRGSYGLTRREADVLRELVCTEDKQNAISDRLNIKVKTLQDYVTRLYRKTGTSTRSGLTDLYHRTMTN
ncbi:MAG: hypothetical protein IKS18_07105 [Lachnospiraceae bacterium]|nr:hypothetical protein [Lachnospiraceae bacterium]